MSTAQKIDLKDIELVPTDVTTNLVTEACANNGTVYNPGSFAQQLTKGRCMQIKPDTFKALLTAAAKCLAFAQSDGSDLAKERAKHNYDYYFNQINMEDGDAVTMFMYSHDDWEL